MNLKDSVEIKKNSVLADSGKRITVKTGAIGYTSDSEVKAEADSFDTDLNNFLIEIDENPVFGLRQYEKFDDKEKQSKHQKFVTAISGLVYDWRGDDKEQESTLDFFPGYYRELKKMSFAGSDELAAIKAFESNLKDRRKQYEDLGYKLDIKPSEHPSDQKKKDDGMKIPWGWIVAGGVVLVVGFAAVQFAPVILASKLYK